MLANDCCKSSWYILCWLAATTMNSLPINFCIMRRVLVSATIDRRTRLKTWTIISYQSNRNRYAFLILLQKLILTTLGRVSATGTSRTCKFNINVTFWTSFKAEFIGWIFSSSYVSKTMTDTFATYQQTTCTVQSTL